MSRLSARIAAWLLVVGTTLVVAQTGLPPPQQMVEALKPAATRGVSGDRPSLSLPVQFEANSARVRPVSGPLLGNLVAALLAPELQASRFVIEGHGEPSGTAQANQLLSQQRADEVRLYLVALGVPAARLRAVGQAASGAAAASEVQPVAADRGMLRVVAHD